MTDASREASGHVALRGVIPILAMTFTAAGEIDVEGLHRQANWTIGTGVDGIGLALGSELPRLTEAERARAIELVSSATADRVPLVVHASAESAKAAVALARDAEARGAGALMIHPPTFHVVGAQGVAAFYRELLAETLLPVVLQDIPNARVDLRLVSALASEYPDRILLKMEVPPTFLGIEQAVGALGEAVPVFGGGAGAFLYSELIRGASGTMPGTALSDFLVDVWSRFESGDRDGARAVFRKIVGFLVTTGTPGMVPAFNREALVLRGVLSSAHGRTPGYQLTDADRTELQELLADLNVLSDARGL